MTLVVDASLVIAALLNDGPEGAWARELLASDDVATTHHLPAEVAACSAAAPSRTKSPTTWRPSPTRNLPMMSLQLHPYEPYADRIWRLRHTVTIPDAWYVAIAEFLEVPLATLDLRLTRAPGPHCEFRLPGP